MDSDQYRLALRQQAKTALPTARSISFAAIVANALIAFAGAEQGPSNSATSRSPKASCGIELVEVAATTGERRMLLRVFDDGQIEAASPMRGGPLVKDQIGRESAARLEREINQLLKKSDVSNDSLAAERKTMSARTGLSADFPDADELILKVRSEGAAREVGCRAVELLAERFPDAQDHQSLRNVHERLLNVIAVTQAGGRKAAERLAVDATRQLHAEHPAANDWTADNLCSIRCLPNRSRFIQFRRREVHASAGDRTVEYWVTNIIEMPGEPTRVSVVAPDRVTR
jgi:hypothetical protein